jgi:D-sedoheptulose 7-phosphate isomerase
MLELAEKEAEAIPATYLRRLSELLCLVPPEPIGEVVELLLKTRATGHRVYVMGNGGSATTASHLVCDLTKTARMAGLAPLRAFALADNTAALTAWANDTAYAHAFAGQIDGLVDPQDVVIAITASGNSPNIVAGLEAASRRGAHTVALVGFDGGAAGLMADITVHIPCHDYGLVEDTHVAIGHALTKAILRALQPRAQ